MSLPLLRPLALAALLAAAPCAAARAELDPSAQVALELQANPTYGLMSGLTFTGIVPDLGELRAGLAAPLPSLLSFFRVEGDLRFVGQTRSFLPINLMPVMGMGLGSLFRDVPDGKGGTTTDIGIYMTLPVGLRYALSLGGLSLTAEASYLFTVHQFMESRSYAAKSNPSRWRFELGTRLGGLSGSAFYEAGPLIAGPGLRLGYTF